MSKNEYTLFQKYCENAIGQIPEECIQTFRETKDDESRIRLLYDTASTIPIHLSENNGKDFNVAQNEKIKGNLFFSKKDYANALKSYSTGIIKCPQHCVAERELLTFLIANRSATYYELKEYKRVFNDIDYLLEIGNYPLHLQYKIWLRKGKCYDALQNKKSASEAYAEALNNLKHSKLDEKMIDIKIREIEEIRLQDYGVVQHKNEIVPLLNREVFVGGQEYVSANPKLTIEHDSYQGRYARASEDIDIGTIIVAENPHCAVVDADHSLINCQNCFLSIDQPVACPGCSFVVFCSTICERLANKSFHKIECSIRQTLYKSGASVNCALALRIISQKHFSYFNDKKNKLRYYLIDNCKKDIIKKRVYRYDDYDNVFFLCRNENMRKKEELIHYTCMAIFLLRLLKLGRYFPFETLDTILNEEEIYFGGLILRHLQMLQFNAHEVSELRNLSQPINHKGISTKYENATIGAAVYPTLALFNHSCDPCIVRYNIKGKIIVRTIKPIRAGDIIYENYGPLYMSMPIEERQLALESRYWFDCLCIPCVEMWPKFDEMHENELRFPCKTDRCPFVFIVHADNEPFLTCEYCHKVTSILPNLKGLMGLDEILLEAESLFTTGQLENAMEKFINGLKILYMYIRPPHIEIIKVQQRVRICMIHMGNRSFDYKMELL